MLDLMPTTAAHVQDLYGGALPRTIIGITGVEAGKPLGIGAIYIEDGCVVLACRMNEAGRQRARRYARRILIAGRQLLLQASAYKLPVRAIADPQYPRSAALLERLGFRHIDKDLFEWIA